MNNWNKLSIQQKSDLMRVYLENGISSLDAMKEHYNSFATGGQMNTDESKEDKNNKGHVTFGTYDEYGNIIPMYHLNQVNVGATQPYRTPEQEAQVTRERNMYFDAMRHFNYGNQDAEGLKETYAKYPELRSYLKRIGMSENDFMSAATGRDYETNSYERERTRQFNKDIQKAETDRANTFMQAVQHQNPNDQKLAAIMTGILGGVTGIDILGGLTSVGQGVNALNTAKTVGKTALNFMGRPVSTLASAQGWTNILPAATAFDQSLMGTLGLAGVYDATSRGIKGEIPWYDAIGEGALSGLMTMDLYPVLKGGVGLVNDAANFARDFRFSVPKDANRYYRYVGDDAIADYIRSGVIRASGANPNFQRPTVMFGNRPVQLGKTFDYSMFSKGKPWEGSLSSSKNTQGKKAKQLNILRSKENTGDIVWEESNKDFRHKGHAGIFRPNYFGDLNATPTDYFEWWEPKKIGYLRHEFPTSSQPKWLGEYPKDNSKFGSFIDEGSEQTVFDNGKDVIKINFERSDNTVKEMLEHANKTITNRNSVSEQIPISLEGFVSEAGSKPKLHAVYRQEKLGSAYDLDEDTYQRLFADLSQRLRQNGWLMKYSDKYYNPELDKTLLDVTRQNVGVKDGKLYIFDGYVEKDGGKLK